ncbi:glycosyltransferase family 2 protein [Eionea flava]
MKCCIVIPHYKHEMLFSNFLPKLIALNKTCIVVDDGSGKESLGKLRKSLEPHAKFYLIAHQNNRGKGAAVVTGCHHASAMGFTHFLQIDADGQHNVDDIAKLLEYSEQHTETIVCGQPYFDDSAPKIRVYGRKLTVFFNAIETLSLKVKDGLCGFRVYPIKAFEKVIDNHFIGARMDFDSEFLVKSIWSGVDVKFFPTKVIYHKNTVSHFNYIRDNHTMIKLHIRLITGMLIRLPYFLYRKIKKSSQP